MSPAGRTARPADRPPIFSAGKAARFAYIVL